MHYRSNILGLLAVSLLAFAPGKAKAAESFDSCKGTITTLPATISTPGTWCLKQDLASASTTSSAITINTNDVTLDCNGFKLDGSSAGTATKAMAVRTAAGISNATVRHCNIRGFYMGVYFAGANGGHLIEDNHLDNNTVAGIWAEGDGTVVRNNTILDTGGSTVVSGAFGIYTRYSADVLNNIVSGVIANAGDTYGIRTYSNPSGSVDGNRVRGVLASPSGFARGIDNAGSSRITLIDNNVVGDGSASSIGLRCATSNGRAKGNIVTGFATGMTGCGNAGGNDVLP